MLYFAEIEHLAKNLLRKHYDFQGLSIVLMRNLLTICMEALPSQPLCRVQRLTGSVCAVVQPVPSLPCSAVAYNMPSLGPSLRYLAKFHPWRLE